MLWLPAGVFVSQPAERTDVQTAGEPKTRGTNQLTWKVTTNTDTDRNINSETDYSLYLRNIEVVW